MTPEPKPIHLLDDSLTRTHCGLDATDLPREEVTGLPRRANCPECHRREIDQMYRNYEQNTQKPIRGHVP